MSFTIKVTSKLYFPDREPAKAQETLATRTLAGLTQLRDAEHEVVDVSEVLWSKSVFDGGNLVSGTLLTWKLAILVSDAPCDVEFTTGRDSALEIRLFSAQLVPEVPLVLASQAAYHSYISPGVTPWLAPGVLGTIDRIRAKAPAGKKATVRLIMAD